MAMPSSGCIALRTCITGIVCSSISCAVAGIACNPASLASLSVQAGKSAPHGMTEFYGYSAGISVSMDMSWTGNFGSGNGFSGTVRLRCSTSPFTSICSCSFASITSFNLINWTSIPAGTYYVDFAQIQANVSFVGVAKEQCWLTNASNGTSDQTNTFTANQSVSYSIWAQNGGGGETEE